MTPEELAEEYRKLEIDNAALRAENDRLRTAAADVLADQGNTIDALRAAVTENERLRAELAPTPAPRVDVYVRARNVFPEGLRTQRLDAGVHVDWWTDADGAEHVAGVEVLDARGVKIDGQEASRPDPPAPETP